MMIIIVARFICVTNRLLRPYHIYMCRYVYNAHDERGMYYGYLYRLISPKLYTRGSYFSSGPSFFSYRVIYRRRSFSAILYTHTHIYIVYIGIIHMLYMLLHMTGGIMVTSSKNTTAAAVIVPEKRTNCVYTSCSYIIY